MLNGAPMVGAGIDDGIASVRGMVAIARSAAAGGQAVNLADVDGVV